MEALKNTKVAFVDELKFYTLKIPLKAQITLEEYDDPPLTF